MEDKDNKQKRLNFTRQVERLALTAEGKTEEEIIEALDKLTIDHSQEDTVIDNPAPSNMTPEEALTQLQQQMLQMVEEVKKLKSTPPHIQPTTTTTAPNSWQEVVLQNFLKSSYKLHVEVNPDNPILAYDGSNYQLWKDAIDGTLQHAFSLNESVIKKTNDLLDIATEENHAITSLIRNTVVKPLRDLIQSSGEKTANKMFKLMKTKCERSDRRHKIDLMSKLIELVNDPTPADKLTLSKWAKVMSDLGQSKVTLDEAGGILLQSHFKPPLGTDAKTFEFSIDQTLNEKDSPSFDDVTTVIQLASSKLKPKSGASNFAPMELDRIHAFNNGGRHKYVTPQRRGSFDKSSKLDHPLEMSLDTRVPVAGAGTCLKNPIFLTPAPAPAPARAARAGTRVPAGTWHIFAGKYTQKSHP
ncbi:Dcp1p-Dcp2p decapping enzyme complex alpha subunit [Puccinia graminis f. sp. tritici]|uniref:Dcp1p-Dcp2p decapping enzyme complex alpha subunit n=1 Tax=Puccinia graminis f. sp. tritici TaxID=56615 RepID=A0A5B0M256_PUCGR|nr:Dcp1p-Dcp2p decapping enzyme complex alpha subunit [Puccinia graminis f. sp. tritici]KAA1089981.1 Dcp1p-Dcp2p decapping enzyme complex alpha subunit [Puccinia graminis f. sp. tritici]